jgi:outer membrane protein OmpA-like peptidoglycan-associated protein
MSTKRKWSVGIACITLLVASLSFAQVPPEKDAKGPAAAAKPVADTRGDQPTVTAPPGAVPGEAETADVVSQPAGPRGALTLPTLTGQTGLFRTATTDVGVKHHFKVSLHGEGFTRDGFLAGCPDTGTCLDTNSRVAGNLTVAYTPSSFAEIYAAWLSSSNANPLVKAYAPELINALGDFLVGAKGRLPVAKGFELGLDFNLRFLNGVSQASVDFNATNVWVAGIASFDFRPHVPKLPLRAHLNIGYLYDRSAKLKDGLDLDSYRPCVTGGNGQPGEGTTCDNLHLVLDYAYGIYPSRTRIAFGLDSPLRLGQSVMLRPVFEYHADIGTDRDPYFENRATAAATTADPNPGTIKANLDGAVMQWLTLGVRLSPLTGLTFDLGFDVGLASPGYAYGPPVVPWNFIFGVTYAYDPIPQVERRTKIVTLTREVVRPPVEGTVRGVVTDATTKKPVTGAVVRFGGRPATGLVTADNGMFTSYPITAGAVDLEVLHDRYQPATAKTVVTAGAESTVEVALTARPPVPGKVRGLITDEVGAPLGATVKLAGAQKAEVTVAPGTGKFETDLAPGEYIARVEADGFLARERTLSVQSGVVVMMDAALRSKPKTSLVELTPDQIKVKKAVFFKKNGSQLDPNSIQLLDEVVDVLARHPQIKRVRVEGHTDNTGQLEANLQLSKERAKSVADFLLAHGVAATRVESEGYGPTKPLVPNLGARNKAKNRRVEFKILEQ